MNPPDLVFGSCRSFGRSVNPAPQSESDEGNAHSVLWPSELWGWSAPPSHPPNPSDLRRTCKVKMPIRWFLTEMHVEPGTSVMMSYSVLCAAAVQPLAHAHAQVRSQHRSSDPSHPAGLLRVVSKLPARKPLPTSVWLCLLSCLTNSFIISRNMIDKRQKHSLSWNT